jgi:hypothetical protein
MNLSTLSVTDWCELVGAAGAVLGAIGYMVRLYLRSNFVTKDDLGKHRHELDSLGKRTGALEAQSAGLATSADVNKVLLAIERADGDRKALAEKIAGVEKVLVRIEKPLDLMQEHLLRSNA